MNRNPKNINPKLQTLEATPSNLNPKNQSVNLKTSTLNLEFLAPNPLPKFRNPKPSTLKKRENEPQTSIPTPQIVNPRLQTLYIEER